MKKLLPLLLLGILIGVINGSPIEAFLIFGVIAGIIEYIEDKTKVVNRN